MAKYLEIEFKFKRLDNQSSVSFKVDGERFSTSSKTLKFFSGVKYRISIKVSPPADFYNLSISGSDLALHCDRAGSGEFGAEWNTTGLGPTEKAKRDDVTLVLNGPGGRLTKVLQAKFYAEEDAHGAMGQRLDGLLLKCAADGHGLLNANDETWK